MYTVEVLANGKTVCHDEVAIFEKREQDLRELFGTLQGCLHTIEELRENLVAQKKRLKLMIITEGETV